MAQVAGTNPMRIALFGGTFDPPHVGHVACVRIAQEEFGDLFDKVLVTPSNLTYYKDAAGATSAQRLAMCEYAFEHVSDVEIWDADIARGNVTYTADTVRDVYARYGEGAQVTVILGADSYASLPAWKDAEFLRENVAFIVIPRAGGKVDTYWNIHEETSATTTLSPHAGFTTYVAQTAAPQVSSATLRGRLSRGESVAELLSAEVLWYIRQNHLYGCEL